MKYIDEFRDPAAARVLLAQIQTISTRPVQFMEFCGGHTHAIFEFGLRQMLPETVRLSSGPGCPVCVTSMSDLALAFDLLEQSGVILTTFGDMMRVPGPNGSLLEARSRGADVRMVYSPLDALSLARETPDREVVFLGVGFETTAPTVAATLLQAEAEALPNFYVLSLHKLTIAAIRAILAAGEVTLDGVIGPGHVAAIIGADAWGLLPDEYGIPCAISGFEPLDMLRAIKSLVEMAEEGAPAVINTYGRVVSAEGNRHAQQAMARVFTVGSADWRGFGTLPDSGLHIRREYAHRDARVVFALKARTFVEPKGCRCGDVLRGTATPLDCALFGRACTPASPVGPCMVSSEGACSAYYQYGAGDNDV